MGPSGSDRPRKSVIVCMTPRSGSTLLCDYLAQSEVVGRPEEYFLAESWDGLLAAHGVADAGALVSTIATAGTGDNGVFGLKLGIGGGVLGRMLHAVEAATGDPGLDGIWAAFGPPTFIWATRRDKLRQAISWWRAIQTGRWRHAEPDPDRGPEPPDAIDHDAVSHLLRELAHREAAWDRFFQQTGVVPITVVYEDWIRRREDTLRDLFRVLGEHPASLPVDSALRRQADAHTERWRTEVIERVEATWRNPTSTP